MVYFSENRIQNNQNCFFFPRILPCGGFLFLTFERCGTALCGSLMGGLFFVHEAVRCGSVHKGKTTNDAARYIHTWYVKQKKRTEPRARYRRDKRTATPQWKVLKRTKLTQQKQHISQNKKRDPVASEIIENNQNIYKYDQCGQAMYKTHTQNEAHMNE